MTKTLQNLSRVAVGIDVGTSAVKVIAVARRRRGPRAPRSAVPALDADVRAGRNRILTIGGRRLRRRSTVSPTASPASASRARCTAWSRSIPSDRPIRPAILWNDQRTGAECAEIEERVGFDRLVELTGNRALTGFTAPKLLWLRKHEPENYERIAHVMLPKDYVRLRLTGERAIDVADASGTLLLDVAQRRWSDEVLDDPRGRPGLAADGARVAGGLRPDARAGSRSRRARATRPRAGSASASTGPGR